MARPRVLTRPAPLPRRPRPLWAAVILAAALATTSAAAAAPQASAASAACQSGQYRVKHGDTLYALALRFHTSVPALARANKLDPNGILLAGAVLKVPRAGCKTVKDASGSGGSQSPLIASLDRAIVVPGVSREQTGVVVVDLDRNTVIYSMNMELALEPASTEKLPVAMTALQRLGGGFRTYTDVLAQGAIATGTWHGDLFLKGYGDPALTTAGLDGLARAVRKRGIRTVAGRVIGDESYFDSVRTCPGWKPSFAKDESPLLSALVVNRGLLDGRATDSPALAAATLFTRALRRAGIAVTGEPAVAAAPSITVRLARRASPQLSTLLAQMDTWSDNFIAEMVLKQIGARLAGRGSTAAGAAAIGTNLAANGVPLTGVLLADGSGLSSLNRLTARSLAAMLQTIWHVPKLRPLISTFAVAGLTGTLRHRLLEVSRHTLLRGKTGTTDNSSALAGFAGSRFAFAVLVNGAPVDWQAAHVLQDQVATALLAATA